MTAAPIGTARRITKVVERYQNICSTGLRTGAGRRKTRRASLRTSSASRRSPATTMTAGATTMAADAANTTTAIPA